MEISQVTIIGLGLMGGSLGLALKAKNKDLKIIGVARKVYQIEKAISIGAIDQGFSDPIQGVFGSELVVIATPINCIKEIVLKIVPFLKPFCVITDMGSTKNEIVSSLNSLPREDVNFVGSHPLAGSHLSGIEAAEENLFQDSFCIVTPFPSTCPKALTLVKEFWELLGSKVFSLTPLEHDEIVSSISHLPHIIASALVNIINVLQNKFPLISKVITPSFKDMTRIAASNPYMWSNIILSNKEALLKSLSLLKEKISYWEEIIRDQEKAKIEEELINSKKWKEEY